MSNGNTRVDVASEGAYHLGLALDLALIYHTGPSLRGKEATVSHWHELDGNLIFSWHENGGGHALPAPCNKEMLIPIIIAWLKTKDYGNEPDIDGDVVKGWRLRSHRSLMLDSSKSFYFQFMVEPHWMLYGK